MSWKLAHNGHLLSMETGEDPLNDALNDALNDTGEILSMNVEISC